LHAGARHADESDIEAGSFTDIQGLACLD